jgi:hypothetical protein
MRRNITKRQTSLMRDGPHDIPSVLVDNMHSVQRPRISKAGSGPSFHGEAAIIRGGRTPVLPNIDVSGTDCLALVGIEATGEQSEDVACNSKEYVKGILGGAYARILEGRLLVVGWRHESERG